MIVVTILSKNNIKLAFVLSLAHNCYELPVHKLLTMSVATTKRGYLIEIYTKPRQIIYTFKFLSRHTCVICMQSC